MKDKIAKAIRTLLPTRKKLVWFFVLCATLIIIPHFAEALIGISPGDIFIYIVKALAFLVNYIAGMIFAAAGFLVKLAFDFNNEIMGPKNLLVHVGWQITRDIANFGFVVVMIGIAFSFIVGYEKYGTWDMLKKLLVAAITINFSFAIVGVIVEFSDSITRYFLSMIEPTTEANTSDLLPEAAPEFMKFSIGDRVALKLADAFGPQKFFTGDQDPLPFNPEEQAGGLITFGTSALNSIAGIFFTIIFTIIGAITLFGLAIMLFVRFIALTILIIAAPLAWLASVVPELSGQNSKWWNELFKWVFFAPQVTFFIYIALVFVGALADSGLVPPTAGNYAAAISTVLIQGINMAIICAILFTGLQTASGTGIVGGKLAMSMANKANKFSQNFIKQRGKNLGSFVASKTLGSAAGRKFTTTLQQFGRGSGKVNQAISRTAGILTLGAAPALVRGIGNLAANTTKAVDQEVEVATKELSGKSRTEKLRMLHSARGALKVAILKDLGKDYNDTMKEINKAENEELKKIKSLDSAEAAYDGIERRKKEAKQKIGAAELSLKKAKTGGDATEIAKAEAHLTEMQAKEDKLLTEDIPAIQERLAEAQDALKEAGDELKKMKGKRVKLMADIKENTRPKIPILGKPRKILGTKLSVKMPFVNESRVQEIVDKDKQNLTIMSQNDKSENLKKKRKTYEKFKLERSKLANQYGISED